MVWTFSYLHMQTRTVFVPAYYMCVSTCAWQQSKHALKTKRVCGHFLTCICRRARFLCRPITCVTAQANLANLGEKAKNIKSRKPWATELKEYATFFCYWIPQSASQMTQSFLLPLCDHASLQSYLFVFCYHTPLWLGMPLWKWSHWLSILLGNPFGIITDRQFPFSYAYERAHTHTHTNTHTCTHGQTFNSQLP